MKSDRDSRTARFELSDSCPELLGVKAFKEISFSNTDLVSNGVAEGSVFQ